METKSGIYTHIRGTGFKLRVWVWDSDPRRRHDLSGDTIRFAIAEEQADGNLVTLIDNDAVTITNGGASGVITVVAPPALFEAGTGARLPDERYHLQVNVVAAGVPWCVAIGELRLQPGIRAT